MKLALQFAIGALLLSSCTHRVETITPPALDYVFEAEPATIAPGESTTLHWNIPGAEKVLIESGLLLGQQELTALGTFGPQGSLVVKPTGDTTYVITCEGSTTLTCVSTSVRVRVGK